MIIASIVGPGIQEACSQIAAASRYADAFEYRLDLIREPFISRLFTMAGKPVVATCRPKSEGGGFEGNEKERLTILETASMLGSKYVDIEMSAGMNFIAEFRRTSPGSKLILSYHSFTGGRIDVRNLYGRMRKYGAAVLKFAYMANDAADLRYAIEFMKLARSDNQKGVALAMGEYGEPSRLLYRKLGCWGTYASTGQGNEAAPGQLTVKQLKMLYRTGSISRRTRVYGVVGNPLAQSKGVYLHNPLFRRAGRDAVYCRLAVKDVAGFMKYVVPLLSGFSVTIPHKQTIMPFLDSVDPVAKAIGAVNTVIRKNGKLYGTNTDAPGALDAIEAVVKVRGMRMLVVGAGGAARAIAYEANRRGASVFVANRTASRAKRVARELRVSYVNITEIRKVRYDVLVNTTPVGMVPNVNATPLPKSMLASSVVFDAVFNPEMTRLLRDAREAGARVISGIEMYLNQAALQSELYTGKRPTTATMKRILESSEKFS